MGTRITTADLKKLTPWENENTDVAETVTHPSLYIKGAARRDRLLTASPHLHCASASPQRLARPRVSPGASAAHPFFCLRGRTGPAGAAHTNSAVRPAVPWRGGAERGEGRMGTRTAGDGEVADGRGWRCT